jgi:hypothetical protein
MMAASRFALVIAAAAAASSSASSASSALSASPASRAAAPAVEGPCDILGAAGNPCVAAHSTVRALFGAYSGALYRLLRASDNATADIGVLSPGGFADAAAHDAFCGSEGGASCVVLNVFDQSPMRNDLYQRHALVNASQHRIAVGGGGVFVYGMWFEPHYGYHVDNTTGVPKGAARCDGRSIPLRPLTPLAWPFLHPTVHYARQ